MRPAGKGPLDSLYFNYPIFPARRVAELDGAVTRHPVAIVGAGPIGMTAALVLARYGIRSVLIDRKDTFNDGSRAICIARPSMHILERIGAVAPFLAKALGWRFGRSYYRGEQIFQLEMPQPPGEKYLPMYNLQQQYIEKFLHDAVAASDLIDMRWQSELSDIETRTDGVSVRISSPEGDYRLDADYVLAADGARSPIRSMLWLRLKGETFDVLAILWGYGNPIRRIGQLVNARRKISMDGSFPEIFTEHPPTLDYGHLVEQSWLVIRVFPVRILSEITALRTFSPNSICGLFS